MNFFQRFIILLTITTNLILITDRIEAAKIKARCRGKLLKRNITRAGSRKLERIHHDLQHLTIPEKFDAREAWPFCKSLHVIKHQGDCGACWAFASSSVMADRLCIASNGKFNHNVSEQDLMECCRFCYPDDDDHIGGCEGGFVDDAFEFWKQRGVVTGRGGCKPTPESIKKGIPQTKCRLKCTDKQYKIEYEEDKTFAIRIFREPAAGDIDVRHIMAEIMLNGPVVGSIVAYDYLDHPAPDAILTYDESLIDSDEEPVDHAVKIIGWDNINNTPVWIIANSWGPRWCNKGFCYIKRGELGIENNEIVAGTPKVNKKHNLKLLKLKNVRMNQDSGSNFIKITNPIEAVLMLYILNT